MSHFHLALLCVSVAPGHPSLNTCCSDCRSGGILLVIHMDNENDLQGSSKQRVNFVSL